ncbi:MAG: hypothetical protein ACE5EV_03520 [Gaiellales bacterium]
MATTQTSTTVASAFDLPASPAVATIDRGYAFSEGSGLTDTTDLPFDLGSISVAWYQAEDRVFAVLAGLDLDATGPACLGAWVEGADGPEHISNSPSVGADCTGAPNVLWRAPGRVGVQVCGPTVSFISQIPSGTSGEFVLAVEFYDQPGSHRGASGSVEADGAALPTVEGRTQALSGFLAELTC